MQVWNVLRAACWKCRTPKKSPKIRHLGTIAQLCSAISLQLRYVSRIGKKLVKHQCLPHISSQYGELQPTSVWDLLASLRHPCKFQQVLHLDSVTARHSSSWASAKLRALKRGRHLYSAGRPSRWALAHISSSYWSHRVCHTIFVWLPFLCSSYTRLGEVAKRELWKITGASFHRLDALPVINTTVSTVKTLKGTQSTAACQGK